MKVTFLGTSHGVAEKNRFLSSTLLTIGGKNYLIDAGAPIMTLLQNNDVDFSTIGGIFITHSHSDHTVGLVDFINELNTFEWFHTLRIPIYVPDEREYHKIFYLLFDSEEFKGPTPIIKYNEGEIFNDGNLKVTSIKNQHKEDSYSFYLEAEGKKFVFSGDLWRDMPDYPKVITDRNDKLDFLVLEGAHTLLNKDTTIQTIRKSKIKKLYINHRGSALNPPENVEYLAEKVKDLFPVIDTFDGMSFEL